MRAILGRYPAGRLVVPFVNVVANVSNEAINYSPLVLPRILEAYRKGQVAGRPAQFNEVVELYAKAAVGMVLGSTLLAVVMAGWDEDDEDQAVDVSGPGPRDGAARAQLKATTGWLPYSIRIGGRWYSYQETPLAVVLGAVGTYADAVKYGRLEERGILGKLAFAVRGMVGVVLDRSQLQGVADLVEAIRKDGQERDEAVLRSLARPLGSVLSSRLVSQIDRTLDPTRMDSSDAIGALLSQVAVARRLGRPALNVWGEPITAPPSERFTSPVRGSRLERALARANAWIPMQSAEELGGRRGDAFTQAERYRFIEVRGPALRAHLEVLIPTIEGLPRKQARDLVSQIARAHSARARAQVMAERGAAGAPSPSRP
jgi:hypothetical protein